MNPTQGPADWGVVGEHLLDPNYMENPSAGGPRAGPSPNRSPDAGGPASRLGGSPMPAFGEGGGGAADPSEGLPGAARGPHRAARAGSFAEWHGLQPRDAERGRMGAEALPQPPPPPVPAVPDPAAACIFPWPCLTDVSPTMPHLCLVPHLRNTRSARLVRKV